MIHINFSRPNTKEWEDWCILCKKEQEIHNQAIESGKSRKVKDTIYKKLKHVYINPRGQFHGKCAYCEVKIFGDQAGDIEHFRPKAGIIDENTGKPVEIKVGKNIKPHPGYYWLAYDWKNLLPSCVLCNRPSSGHSSGPIGKRNFFPVVGSHANSPGGEAKEKPLLIHPVFDYPERYLDVDETGIIYAKNRSLRGKTCIRIFGLNERDLPNDRRKTYKDVKLKLAFLSSVAADFDQNTVKGYLSELIKIKEGFEAFTSAARKAIADYVRAHQSIFRTLGNSNDDNS